MSTIILHHYPTSPFSEKVRLILGYKAVPWQSVMIPRIMPKPDVVALTGGYRRTPFMQIGSDIYCDTALICDELERRFPTPTLYPVSVPRGLVDTLAQWADTTLFWQGAVGYVFQPKALAFLFADAPPEAAKAFAVDRAEMRKGTTRVGPAEAAGALKVFLHRLDTMLQHSPYLLADTPSLADFSAYHPLWFVRRVEPIAGIFNGTTNVLPWMDRMAAAGQGAPTKCSSTDAITLAAATPTVVAAMAWQDEHGIEPGAAVNITPLDYAFDPVAGALVISSDNQLAIKRVDERAGEVIVHFPRVGYKLERAA